MEFLFFFILTVLFLYINNFIHFTFPAAQKIDTGCIENEKNETDKEQKVEKAETNAKEENNVEQLEKSRMDERDLLEWGIKISNSLKLCHDWKQKFLDDYKKWCPVRNKTVECLKNFLDQICTDENWNNYRMIVFNAGGSIGKNINLFTSSPFAITIGLLFSMVEDIEKFIKNRETISGFSKINDSKKEGTDIDKDMDLFSEMQNSGSNCENQFKETGEILKQFHDMLVKEDLENLSSDSGFREFFIELTELDSRHHIFFPQIAEAFRKLQGTKEIGSRPSKLYNAFCGSIRMDPSILDTMGMLDWSPSSKTSVSSGNASQDNCEELIEEIFDDHGISGIETLKKIRRAIRVLTREKERVDRVATKLKGGSTTGQECKNSSSE